MLRFPTKDGKRYPQTGSPNCHAPREFVRREIMFPAIWILCGALILRYLIGTYHASSDYWTVYAESTVLIRQITSLMAGVRPGWDWPDGVNHVTFAPSQALIIIEVDFEASPVLHAWEHSTNHMLANSLMNPSFQHIDYYYHHYHHSVNKSTNIFNLFFFSFNVSFFHLELFILTKFSEVLLYSNNGKERSYFSIIFSVKNPIWICLCSSCLKFTDSQIIEKNISNINVKH